MAGALKLGLNTGYWAGGPPPGAAESVLEAERLGFDSIWTAEAYGSDCLTPLAWWGAATERIRLGTAIVQMSARQPAATAMAAMTLDHLSGGRFILGLGVSGPQVVEGWYGMPFAKPLARTREYVSILREIWGPAYGEESNYLHVYVSHLRRKIEPDPARPRYLLTQAGVGYRLVAPDSDVVKTA